MKRAVLSGPETFRLDEVPVPRPAPGDALIRIRAVGICGSDLHLFKDFEIGGQKIGPNANFVLGHECMGTIEDVGTGVDRKLVGQRVFIEPSMSCGKCRWCVAGQANVCPHNRFLGSPPVDGALANFLAHPAHLCEVIPDAIDDDTAVLLEPLAIAVYSMDRVQPKPGSSCVILGAGTIGLTHLMLLARTGLHPLIVTDLVDARLAMARELGATHTFNPQRDDVVARVKELTHGYGADFVFECCGEPETFRQMVEVAAPAGRVGVVGIASDDKMSFKASAPRRKGLDLLMIRRANLTFERALNRTLNEKLPLKRLATHHWPLDRVADGFRTSVEYRDGVVKGMIGL